MAEIDGKSSVSWSSDSGVPAGPLGIWLVVVSFGLCTTAMKASSPSLAIRPICSWVSHFQILIFAFCGGCRSAVFNKQRLPLGRCTGMVAADCKVVELRISTSNSEFIVFNWKRVQCLFKLWVRSISGLFMSERRAQWDIDRLVTVLLCDFYFSMSNSE